MHQELKSKIENYQYLCHSTSVEYTKEILQNGYMEDIYATIDRENQFREGCKIIFTIDEDLIEEDPCIEGDKRVEKEWQSHDQVFMREVDFCLNAHIIKIITTNDELNQIDLSIF